MANDLEQHGGVHAPKSDEFHLTVQFLGETDESDVAAIGRALEAATAPLSPFELRYGGLGAFPSPERARVVWAAATEIETPPGQGLQALAAAIGGRLGALGYPPEARRLHPHVTLGRVRGRPPPALVDAIEAGKDLDLGREWVSELKLILSQPGDRGYRYIDLTTAMFEGPDGS